MGGVQGGVSALMVGRDQELSRVALVLDDALAGRGRLAAADNVAMVRLARRIRADLVRRDSATVLYEIPLVPAANPHHPKCRTGEASPEAAA